MSNKIKSSIFDFFQIGSIIFIFLTGPVIASNIISIDGLLPFDFFQDFHASAGAFLFGYSL